MSDETEYDPSEHKVDEVLKYVEKHPDEAEAIAAAELEGKDRSTLVAALPEPAKKSKRKAQTGSYTLEAGDSPATLAKQFYGRGSRGREIVAANPDVKWVPGAQITIPE